VLSFGQTKQAMSQQQAMPQAAPIVQNTSSIYSIQQASAQHYQMTSTTLQNTATANAANNIASNMTYKTTLMRTHAGYGREDMNIEDIHC